MLAVNLRIGSAGATAARPAGQRQAARAGFEPADPAHAQALRCHGGVASAARL